MNQNTYRLISQTLRRMYFCLLLVLSTFSLSGQSYYQVLEDFTGQNRNATAISAAAEAFAEELPEQFRDSFKVLEYDGYLYEENMHGQLEQLWTSAENQANLASSYYILFVYSSTNKSFNTGVKTFVKLPSDTSFCLDLDLEAIVRGITNGEAQRELSTPNVDMGMIQGLNKASRRLKTTIDSCGIGNSGGFTGQEMIDALVASGYYALSPAEIVAFNQSPGGGVQGNVDIKLNFEDHGTDLSYVLQGFLQNGGSYARIRKFDKTNDTIFKVDKPTGTNWQDAVYINKDGAEAILINLSIDPAGEGLVAGQVLYYAVRWLYEVGSEVLFDALIQLVLEKYTTGDSWATAWDRVEIDGASLRTAFVSGSMNFVTSLFGAGVSSTKGQVVIQGLNAVIQYILSFNQFDGDPNKENQFSVSGFNLQTLVDKFISGASHALFKGKEKNIQKYIDKLVKTLSNPSIAKAFYQNLVSTTAGQKVFDELGKVSPMIGKTVRSIPWITSKGGKKITKGINDEIDNTWIHKQSHIINGSNGKNHNWEKLIPNKNHDDIKDVLKEVLEHGTEGVYKKEGLQKTLAVTRNGITRNVLVTFNYVNDIPKIGNGLVLIK